MSKIINREIIYRHYKGGFYAVLHEVIHSETLETLVVYQGENGSIWARPKEMFYGFIEVDGKTIKRFAKCH